MRTAPTFVQEAETAWNSSTTPKTTPSFNVQADDVLVAIAGAENANSPLETPVGGSLTWVAGPSQGTSFDTALARIWSAIVDANKSMTVQFARSLTGSSNQFGGNVLTFRHSDGIGASAGGNNGEGSGAPALNITTTQDNSAIVMLVVDWNATSGASRVYRQVNGASPVEVTFDNSGAGSVYVMYGAYYADAGPAGTKTVGLTSPASQRYSIVAIEVLGTESDSGATVELEGAAVASANVAGALSKATHLAGAANIGASAAGALTHVVPLSGAAFASAIGDGELAIAVRLSGAAFVNALAAAQMTHGVPLAGSATAGAGAAGNLSVSADAALEAHAIASANAAAALQLSIALHGGAIGAVLASADLSKEISLVGDANAQASAAGSLSLTARLTGSANAAALAAGALLGTASLEGHATAKGEAQGTLSLVVPLTAQAVANAVGSGALSVSVRLSGAAIAQALTGGELTVLADVQLQGDAIARAQASGALSVGTGAVIAKMVFARLRSRSVLTHRMQSRTIAFNWERP